MLRSLYHSHNLNIGKCLSASSNPGQFSSCFGRNSIKMLGQAKLSAFFAKKRTLSSSDTDSHSGKSSKCNGEDNPKKAKTVQGAGGCQALSPEQVQRMENNRDRALKKLAAAKLTAPGSPEGISPSWAEALSGEFSKPYFVKLQDFVAQERKTCTIYPPPEQVYTWTQTCNITDVKVVILGQDPYHNVNQAHGLCFSVPCGIKPPPSLENMYKELATDIPGFKHPGHGNLTGWAEQGVLLLNAVLTVRAHTPNSHKDRGWEKFTDAVIGWLNKNREGLVFMLWGAYAQKKGAIINTKRHCVLKSTHPSPLSSYRGFFGCGHFSKANNYLEKSGKEPVDWTRLGKS